MDYYSSRNSHTLLLFLDASRAFDRVQYVKFFCIQNKFLGLIGMGVSVMYSIHLTVSNKGALSLPWYYVYIY